MFENITKHCSKFYIINTNKGKKKFLKNYYNYKNEISANK